MSDKVVWLDKARKNSKIEAVADPTPQERESLYVLVCDNCRNKTFVIVYQGDTFPKLQCCVCGMVHGHIGWKDRGSD